MVLPPLCLSCQDAVEEAHGFCGRCWRDFHFITPPLCACCGLPFEFALDSDGAVLCGACLESRPHFEQARAVFSYNEAARHIILPFKHNDRTDYAPALARLMLQAGREFLNTCDIIVPVPLHRFRLFTRRYNQAALLAQALAKLAGRPVLLDALVRPKHTPSQGHLSRDQRKANVKGVFAVRDGAALKDKKILLIDDVVTTGATADEAAKTLLKGGARQVNVLALARVTKQHQ